MIDVRYSPQHAFVRGDGTTLEISSAAWQTMQGFAQHSSDATEAGGVLLGRHLRNGSAIIVDEVTPPLLGDRRSRTRFYRSWQNHQAAMDRAWQESDGTCTYLGEWHTHPEPLPTPSSIDRTDWRRRLRTDTFTEPIFFLIVGTLQTCAWEGTRDGIVTVLTRIEHNQ